MPVRQRGGGDQVGGKACAQDTVVALALALAMCKSDKAVIVCDDAPAPMLMRQLSC